jgi:hypothetical protein
MPLALILGEGDNGLLENRSPGPRQTPAPHARYGTTIEQLRVSSPDARKATLVTLSLCWIDTGHFTVHFP